MEDILLRAIKGSVDAEEATQYIRNSQNEAVQKCLAAAKDLDAQHHSLDLEMANIKEKMHAIKTQELQELKKAARLASPEWTEKAKRAYLAQFPQNHYTPWNLPKIGEYVFINDRGSKTRNYTEIGRVTSFYETGYGLYISGVFVTDRRLYTLEIDGETIMRALKELDKKDYSTLYHLRDLQPFDAD